MSAPLVQDSPADTRRRWRNRRSFLLARALERLDLGEGRSVAVLVCPLHDDDLAVALTAIGRCEATSIVLDPDQPTADLIAALTPVRHGVLLACSEGVAAWERSRVPMRVIGDAPGVVWWRAVELREHKALARGSTK